MSKTKNKPPRKLFIVRCDDGSIAPIWLSGSAGLPTTHQPYQYVPSGSERRRVIAELRKYLSWASRDMLPYGMAIPTSFLRDKLTEMEKGRKV